MSDTISSSAASANCNAQSATGKLRRVRQGAMLSGACGGISEYFGIDVSLVRMGFFTLACLSFVPVAVYLAMTFILPDEDSEVRTGECADIPSLVAALIVQIRQSSVAVLKAAVSFDPKRLARCWDEEIARFRAYWSVST